MRALVVRSIAASVAFQPRIRVTRPLMTTHIARLALLASRVAAHAVRAVAADTIAIGTTRVGKGALDVIFDRTTVALAAERARESSLVDSHRRGIEIGTAAPDVVNGRTAARQVMGERGSAVISERRTDHRVR
jgi:hypothetical protein